MKYVFGPVPSRRLGRSLGVDTVPSKTCNWNCIYCQLGRSTPMITERTEYVPTADVLAELRETLEKHGESDIDWITFSASGEGTLHTEIGTMIRAIKDMTTIPVAVITNGSLLADPAMREALAAADAVLPSLDGGSDEIFRLVDRPHPSLTFEGHVEGLIAFRDAYEGKLWIEVMLIRDVNDSEQALGDIAAVLRRVRPDQVHIVTPTRPSVETWVQPPDDDAIARAVRILGDVAHVVSPIDVEVHAEAGDDLHEAIMGIITRHPMQASELAGTLDKWTASEVEAALRALAEAGRAQCVERHGGAFWTAGGTTFPDEAHSRRPTKRG
jgi:wyosine [tRNA(Phe)-imidazoG37] synthetase (radical SAM superfamily)